MTDPTPDRPLVTFALFAYNQEQYIREAVEGAFSQTYEPLEIILSDDCSSDRTFEIMQEMAAAYEGPHEVQVRKNDINLGLISHINAVFKVSTGNILIFAAGDDVSLPERSKTTVHIFLSDPNIKALCTSVSHCLPSANHYPSEFETISNSEIFFGFGGVGPGAAYSYERSVLLWPSEIPQSIFSEDKYLPARAAVLGRVVFVDHPLVRYRSNNEGLHAKLKMQRSLARQRPEHRDELMTLLSVAKKKELITKFDYLLFTFLLQLRYASQYLSELRGCYGALPLRVVGRTFSNFVKKALRCIRVGKRSFDEVE